MDVWWSQSIKRWLGHLCGKLASPFVALRFSYLHSSFTLISSVIIFHRLGCFVLSPATLSTAPWRWGGSFCQPPGMRFGVSPPVCFNRNTPKSPWRTHRARSDKTSVPFHDKKTTGSSSRGAKNLQQFPSSCPHRLWIPTAQKVSACCSRDGWASGRPFLLIENPQLIPNYSI